VFGSYLHRMILWELFKVFAMSLIALTGLLLMAGIVAEATQRGLTPSQVLMVIPLIIPSTLPYTIPATTLFAASLVYGRLAADNEIIAIKAAGINVLYVVWPSLFLGLVMSITTMGLYYHFIPYSHQLLRSLFLKDVEELLYSMLRHERKINHPKLPYAIWVENVQGKRLINPYFKRRDVNGRYDLVAHAREAELRVDANNKKLIMHMRHGEVYSAGNETRAYFEDRFFDLPMSSMNDLTERQRRPRELTWREILERRKTVAEELEELDTKIAMTFSQLSLMKGPRDIPEHLDNLKSKRFYVQREQFALDTELQMRPALALGCLCFVLVGCPVGIWFSRSDYLSAFITCFLPIVFLYYPILLCGTNMAKEGRFDPAVTTWAADVAMALISLVLFRRLLRH
jgi:lipopolysaccharide export system permease protein